MSHRIIEEPNRPAKRLAPYAVVGLTVLAPALGGSTTLWSQAVLAIATGVLLLVRPPEKSLGWIANCLLVALLAISFTGFLPANWLPVPHWRNDLLQIGVQLPATHSPQPWLTLQWACFLFLGLVWSYYLLAFSWRRRLREQVCIMYAVAVLCLGATLVFAFLTKQRVPFWPQTEHFGFFPNRNQTGNVLGLGGVMIYACGLQALQGNRKYWWLWPISLSVVCWALIVNYSRAGIILLFFGALALHLYWWRTAKHQQRPIVAIGGLALLVALLLINGGATLARFGHETRAMFSASGNLRWLIYKDAFHLFGESPLFGTGLGNFRSIFAFNRFYSASASTAAHPESDWVWSAVDLGLIAPLIVMVLVCWWVKKCLPFDPGTVRLLRVAALICGCAFLAHGLFDVSGHRIGALWPALFLGSIGIHPHAEFKISKWMPSLFRIFGLVLVLVGLWWMSSFLGGTVLPTTATQEAVRNEITSAVDREDYAAVPSLAKAGLQVAPLDWMLYYKRGLAEVALSVPRQLPLRDFAIAKYLNPLWPDLYLREGEVWFAANEPDLAFDIWKEGLRRADDGTGAFYSRILNVAGSDPEMRDRLGDLVDDNHIYLILFLQSASPFEVQLAIDRLLSNDSLLRSLSPNELETIFTIWYEKGDQLELAKKLRARPDWLRIGWKQLALVCAAHQDYRQAYETVLQFDPPPSLPKQRSDESLEKLTAQFQINRTNIDNGLALYFAQVRESQSDAALVTLRKLSALPGSPKYLSYLEAELWAQNGQWKNAWEAVAHFEFQRP